MAEHEPVKTYRFSELRNHPRQPDTSIVSDGLLKKGSLLVIGAPPKSYKSFVLNSIAISIACGRNLFGAHRSDHGRPVPVFTVDKPRRVLIVEQEVGADDLEDRLLPNYLALNSDERMLVDNNLMTHSFDPGLRFDTADGMMLIEEMLKAHKPEIVIFDPLIEFHCQEENSNTAMATILKNFVNLCRRCDVTPMLSHHEGKEGQVMRDGGDRLRGATALFGKGDTFLTLRVINRNSGRIQIDFTVRRKKPIRSMIVRLDPDTLEVNFLCWQGSKEWKRHASPADDSKTALDDLDPEGKIQ